MRPNDHHTFIDGQWLQPAGDAVPIIDPATEETLGAVHSATAAGVDAAVDAARRAFPAWADTPAAERADLLDAISAGLKARRAAVGDSISHEMGMPAKLARMIQAGLPPQHFDAYAAMLRERSFERPQGKHLIVEEPIGVCGLITPWNFPLHQIAGKVAPALAAGCTMVLKPSEITPSNAVILAEVMAEAGLPAGVFNLIHGLGPDVGAALVAHTGVDMVSFTGSTRAGVAVAQAAASTVKRVTQELGGKSANILLDDADFDKAVPAAVRSCYLNSGQACNAPTRLLVPADVHDRAVELAKTAAEAMRVGPPDDPSTHLGPLANATQFDKVRGMIRQAIDDGATLVTGGAERPEGLDRGYYVRPTVFAGVDNGMTIAREEVFGPVLVIIPYGDEDDAVAIANDSDYGLSAYVSGDPDRARAIARRLRAGQVHINGASFDATAPFGGYKQSGNGREFGEWGLAEFLETKAMLGYGAR